MNDTPILQRLASLMSGRIMPPLRKQVCKTIVRRDPRDVAFRYLRRHAGGVWHRGGSHVARLHFGNGIGFLNWRNDRADKLNLILI